MTRALESKAEKIAHLRQRIAQIPARSVTANCVRLRPVVGDVRSPR